MKPEIIVNVHVSLEGPDIIKKYNIGEPEEAQKRLSQVVGIFPLDSYLTIHAKRKPVEELPTIEAVVNTENFGILHHTMGLKKKESSM